MNVRREAEVSSVNLISPYGGVLKDLRVPPEALEAERDRSSRLPALPLSERAVCDLELLATGGFSPLEGFLGREDYLSVLERMRLADGTVFSIPVVLHVDRETELHLDREYALHDSRNELLGVLRAEEIFDWDREEFCLRVVGRDDPRHPLVAESHRWGAHCVRGRLRVLALPKRFDFRELRLTPEQTRLSLAAMGRPNVVAFQTRNPLHRGHEELCQRAADSVDGTLLLHPVVGLTKPGDVDHYTRVRTYRVMISRHPHPEQALLALLPLAMRLAGPREAVWHAIIRRNYGANHLIVGRDHASPGLDSSGKPFFEPYAAQELVAGFAEETGVQPIPFEELVYLPGEDRYEEASRVPPDADRWSISGTQVRQDYLERGRRLPPWFTRPEVADILHNSYPPRHRQGTCIWFTGLSGAGKSTTAEALTVLLQEFGRQVTLLDGDVVRTHLSRGLGFSKEDRDINIRRIGFVASEIARHGGVAICAAISPYRAVRNDVRAMVGGDRFIEVFVDTPLDVCEARDPKGMYAKARRGELPGFTGVDDPYEPPLHPEIVLGTLSRTPEENAHQILDYLRQRGFIRDDLDSEVESTPAARQVDSGAAKAKPS